jgi:hypothetical protein
MSESGERRPFGGGPTKVTRDWYVSMRNPTEGQVPVFPGEKVYQCDACGKILSERHLTEPATDSVEQHGRLAGGTSSGLQTG